MAAIKLNILFLLLITTIVKCNKSNEFNCNIDNKNVNLNKICNGIIDCPNGYDEGDFCQNKC
jgi:hypothetical protein